MSSTSSSAGRHLPRTAAVLLLLVAMAVAGLPGLGARPARAAATCPCSIWAGTAVPGRTADPDTSAVELGVKFRSDTSGFVSGVRFYKGAGNTGTHVGSLWQTDGTRLASATFTAETGAGWQQVMFASPVAVAAGTTYVASYYAPVGHYAADNDAFASAGVDSAPLHALADGADGANGVYRYGAGGGFPANTFRSSNYWVDVVFDTTLVDRTPPTVSGRLPASGATGVPVSTAVSVTFSEPVTGGTGTVSGPAGPVAGSLAYDGTTRTATFQPAAPLSPATTYTVTVAGATDTAGNAMQGQDTWSFTTAASAAGCPCSLWPAAATPARAAEADSSAVELGVRFSSDVAGYVTALRFYKGTGNGGTHTGHLWAADGTLLSSATFSAETATGWQQVSLPAPVAVTAGTSYVASYYAPQGSYAVDNRYFAVERSAAPLRAPADGTGGRNGLYHYGAPAFPTSTFSASNYWVDVVFDTRSVDRTAPSVTGTAPVPGANAVDPASDVTAAFDEAVTPSSVVLSLRTGSGVVVGGAGSYDAGTRTARLHPTTALAPGTSYTASVTATDLAGNAMAAPTTWSFRTATPPPPPPVLDGPVLVVAPSAASFGTYLPELLRAEGLNAYAKGDLGSLTASTLAKYDVVVLGETALTAAQVQTLTTWVTDGGNLVAMRPDRQLAGLLGLTPVTSGATTLSDAYLTVRTSSGPGVGITDQSVQFHGTADLYTPSGATPVATLFSGPTTATTSPAVTVRDVGPNGGQAAAFTYDLARSVVYTRQGNPAYAGKERDGQAPVRSDDMFWGSTATNGYLNLDKVAIPQADEQQRLLVNLIETMDRDAMPLPRFWYFPRMLKAVVIGTGDDHGNGGTAGRFDQYDAASPAGCSLVLWTCLRTTSYVYSSTPLTDSQAAAYDAKGFEVALHPQNGCANYSPASLENDYQSQLSQWQATFGSLAAPVTSRYHCLVWSDWSSQPRTEARHGIGLDTNYYYWPGSWMSQRPGFMTGSGLPMHFADLDGSVLGVYQVATQMTDESGQSYPATPNTLFDNANGPLGYYGAFTANEHTDKASTYESDQLLASARSRGVPIVTARQMLTWLQGRDASSFTNLAWSGSTLTFGITQAAGADGLNALLPTAGATGSLSTLSCGGVDVPFTRQTIKGLEYAVFDARTGSCRATYGTTAAARSGAADAATPGVYVRPGATAAVGSMLRRPGAGPALLLPYARRATAARISDLAVLSLPDGTATVTWTTDVPADSTVTFGAPGAADASRADPAPVTRHSVVLTGLAPGRSYVARAGSTGAATSPSVRFVQSAAGVADTAQLRLPGDDAQEFDLPQLPAGWTTDAESGGRTVVYGGALRLSGTRVSGPLQSGPRTLSASVTFTGDEQSVGLASPAAGPRAVFAGRSGHLFATIDDGRSRREVRLPDSLVGAAHTYSVQWTGRVARLAVDGATVAEGDLTTDRVRTLLRDVAGSGAPLTVDWVRGAAVLRSSAYDSRVLDARQMVTWDRATWQADVPAGTSLRVSVRTGSRPTPDASWTAFTPLARGAVIGTGGRYLQYRVELSTSTPDRTPVLSAIGFTHNGTLPAEDPEVG